jgi:phytoene dehydrogenase-like protein
MRHLGTAASDLLATFQTVTERYDAVVVGAGPNGLTAAAVLAGAGWRVLVREAAPTVGGGTRTLELTLPGYRHDVCSAVHPMGIASPVLRDLPLEEHGVKWLQPEVAAAQPLDDGRVALLRRSVEDTAGGLPGDEERYARLMSALVDHGDELVATTMSPLSVPSVRALPALARFAWLGIRPLATLARGQLRSDEGRALLAGLAAHSMLSLTGPGTGGFGLLMGTLAHRVGWPVAAGGSQAIADALAAVIIERGGEVEVGAPVTSLDELPPARAVLVDVTPTQLVALAGGRLPSRYRRQLARFRRGPGVWKLDWALDGPIPWRAEDCQRTATVHLGGRLDEVVAAEAEVVRGRHPERPFVLVVQPCAVDPTRAPAGGHVGWAYCHVPNGSTFDMTERIEAQVERFAPGFRDRILARHVMGPAAVEAHNANYLGGDISGGRTDLWQLAVRPVPSLTPWRTPLSGVYLCSSSTPPGPGVHGMCGWHAARTALEDARRGRLDA